MSSRTQRASEQIRAASIFQLHKISWSLRVLIAFTLGPLFNWSPSKIRSQLKERRYTVIPSLKAISLFCHRFRASGHISDKPRGGRPVLLKTHHLKFIDHIIRCNREVTVQHMHSRLRELFTISVSHSTLRQAVYNLGWRKTRTRYCQMVREANKPKRLLYSLLCMLRKEDFDDCIFTDEASIEITKGGHLRFRRHDEASVIAKVAKPKHPYKVHVWAGISKKGATNLCVFTGKLNASGLEVILSKTLLPFIKKTYPLGHRFLQDNDPKHTSKQISEFMKSHGVFHWRTPPESPDLNPIEMVWADLKFFLKTKVRPDDKESILQGMELYWSTLTPAKCARFIEHLKKTIPQVVLYGGCASGH